MKGSYQFWIVMTCLLNISFGVHGIGVNYGLLGDKLPPPNQVIGLLRSRGITKIRIFEPNSDVLTALGNSGIEVIVGVRNEDLKQLAEDTSYADKWVNDHVTPYASTTKFTYIAAGNEVIPGPLADYVLNAMQNLDAALNATGLSIPLTTAVSMQVLGTSYPPSNGTFSQEIAVFMAPIVTYLQQQGAPLLVNIYSFFAYVGNRGSIALDYALLENTAKPVKSEYQNMFYAMVDAVYYALEKAAAPEVKIVVSETGWPSGGDPDATIANAQKYINNVIALELSGNGTPKRPGKAVQTYLFALFNEDMKPGGVEQNFGLYHPDMTEVYHANFTA